MNLIETLRDQLDDNTISQLRDEIGAESNEQTESAATAVISSIIAGLNRNVQQPDGATQQIADIIDAKPLLITRLAE